MKKVLLAVLVAGLAASSANAGMLWMQFADGGNEVTLAPSETVVVQYMVTLGTTEQLFGALIQNETALGLDQTNVIATPVGWEDLGSTNNDHLGFGNAEISVGSTVAGQNILSGGEYIIAEQVIHQNDQFVNQDFEITFVVDLAFPRPTLTKPDGSSFSLFADTSPYASSYGIGIAQGSPGFTDTYGAISARQPLIVHCTPEPASLALLGLGALALIRRR